MAKEVFVVLNPIEFNVAVTAVVVDISKRGKMPWSTCASLGWNKKVPAYVQYIFV